MPRNVFEHQPQPSGEGWANEKTPTSYGGALERDYDLSGSSVWSVYQGDWAYLTPMLVKGCEAREEAWAVVNETVEMLHRHHIGSGSQPTQIESFMSMGQLKGREFRIKNGHTIRVWMDQQFSGTNPESEI